MLALRLFLALITHIKLPLGHLCYKKLKAGLSPFFEVPLLGVFLIQAINLLPGRKTSNTSGQEDRKTSNKSGQEHKNTSGLEDKSTRHSFPNRKTNNKDKQQQQQKQLRLFSNKQQKQKTKTKTPCCLPYRFACCQPYRSLEVACCLSLRLLLCSLRPGVVSLGSTRPLESQSRGL